MNHEKSFFGSNDCWLFIFIWLVQGNDFFLFKVFAPKYEEVRRETFKQSQAYNDGMITELQNMWIEYNKSTTEEQKKALRSVILHRVKGYDENKLPNDLQIFIYNLKNQN